MTRWGASASGWALRAIAIGLAAGLLLLPLRAVASSPDGQTIDYASSRREVGQNRRPQHGRAFLHPTVLANPTHPRPLIIFMHGLNREHLPHRWMGGGAEPDVRQLVGSMIDRGRIGPAILAAPGITAECDEPRTSWPGFDLPQFLELTTRSLRGHATIDPHNIILVGHSGAGCNVGGGLLRAMRSKVALRAVLIVDVCMDVGAAPFAANTRPETDVVVTWQPQSWKRPFEAFGRDFMRESKRRGAHGLRVLDAFDLPDESHPHIHMVELSLQKWLPHWLGHRDGGQEER